MAKFSELSAKITETRIPLHYWLVRRENNIVADVSNLTPDDELISIFDYVEEHKGIEEQWEALQQIEAIDTSDYLFILHRFHPWDSIQELIQNHQIEVSFGDESGFEKQYEEWEKLYQRESEDDIRTLVLRRLNNERLRKHKKKMFSPSTVVESGAKFSLRAAVDILPDIFRDIKTSLEVPYVQYNGDTRVIKIFRGYSEDLAPSYNISLPEVQFSGDNTIFLYTWKHTSPNSILKLQTANKADFDVSTITYARGRLNFTIASSTNKEVLIDRIYEALNSDLPRPKAVDATPIVTSVTYYNVNYNRHLFSYAIFNDPIISKVLAISESKRLQDTPTMVLKENPSVTIRIRPDIRLFVVKTFQGKSVTLPTPNVATVTITAESKQQTDSFILLMSSIMSRYMEIRDNIIESVSKYIPDVKDLVEQNVAFPPTLVNGKYDMSYEEKVQQRSKKLSLNQTAAPELFVPGYARAAQNKQPIVIGENEVSAWENKLINGERRQVVLFPQKSDLVNPEANNPRQNYYVCPMDEYPYIERVENTLSNKDVFKYYIQCSNRPSVVPTLSDKSIHVSNRTTFLETFKIAAPGQLGHVDGMESALIGENVNRRGTFLSPNSAILCLISARQPEVNDISSVAAENLAVKIRNSLFDKIHPEIVLQEQFNRNTDLIIEDLQTNSFFDPEKWYRALEERFQVNIYIFWREQADRDRGLPTKLLVPRHKGEYVHHHNPKWKTVYLLRHYGTEVNRLITPQCELLVKQDGTALFDHGLNSALTYASRSLSWEVDNLDILFRQNMFSSIQYDKIFSNITAQHINQDGKLSMIEINSGEYYVHTLPSRPLNLPSIKDITLPDKEFVVSLFGEGDGIGGNWYNIGDIKDAIFVPYNRVETAGVMDTLRRTRKNADYLIQIVMYLRSVYLGSDTEFLQYILEDEDFATAIEQSDILVRGRGVGGDYEIDVPRILPAGHIDDIISELEDMTNMFRNGKLIIRNPKVLASILWNLRIGTEGSRVIKNYYSTPKDYTVQPKIEDVLFGAQSFDQWKVFNGAGSKKNVNLQSQVQTILARNFQPEMYVYTENKKYYIIQGTASGSRGKAIQIALTWATERINLSSRAEVGMEPPVNIYTLSSIGTLKMKYPAESEPSVSILEHGNGYSAILPL